MTYRDLLTYYYPEGSWGGQCGTFAHRLCLFPPVGNSLSQKIKSVNKFGIPIQNLDSFKVGDVLITSESVVFGHVAIINAVGTKLGLTESNFRWDLKVRHTRLLDPSSRDIVGVIRGKLTYPVPFPVLRVKLVQQGEPWDSMADKFKEILDIVTKYSKGRLGIHIDVDYIDYEIPFVGAPQYPTGQGVDHAWYEKYITPKGKGYNAVCLLIPQPSIDVVGWQDYPNKTQIFTEENETIYFPQYPEFGAVNKFIHTFVHEVLGHGLHAIDGQPDTTHQYISWLLPPKFDLVGAFNSLDYNKIASYLNV